MSILPPGPTRKPDIPACTTIGCPERATLLGTLRVDDEVFRDVAYCTECAGYMYQAFEPKIQLPPANDCGHHTWAGLMALLDEHWPEDIFPTREDDETRDAGARIVSLIRWVDRLRSDV